MDERCPGCDCKIEEKLKSLQVLRHIMMTKKKKYEEIRQERCAAHDNKTEEFTKNMAEKLKSLT